MTANELRQSFLDFFREKEHSIVPSASLMPTSPNLLFTNAGMNQFVPYFLGTDEAPFDPPRAADTQKCIRAGGKHNDLEDVGYDTYHHTFFEMLGNWSFGNYFKEEAIAWAWELVVERWGFPPERLYATVYAPGEGDPAAFDEEAYDYWKVFFEKAGLDPEVHIVNGNVKDNFWAMGETGPCGPCSELHVDLTPNGDTKGELVNADDPRCIEIWNLVFIQFNRDEDGTYRPLPAKHVDTGMGFERACSIMQCTDGFKDFSKLASNYDTDVFSPIFAKLAEISGKQYTATMPATREGLSEQEQVDVAFRVIADHIRTLSFSIADGILPGNNGRNYVLRRILRRAVRFGREIGFTGDKPLLPQLVDTLVEQMSHAFPELKTRRDSIMKTLTTEEASFNQTLDRGLALFSGNACFDAISNAAKKSDLLVSGGTEARFLDEGEEFPKEHKMSSVTLHSRGDHKEVFDGEYEDFLTGGWRNWFKTTTPKISGENTFLLYDTYGFPVDLTCLLADELGFEVDMDGFEELMEEQRERARSAQKSEIVTALEIATDAETEFVGFEADETEAEVLEVHSEDEFRFVITDKTPFYAELGGQQGDQGTLIVHRSTGYPVRAVQQIGKARAHGVPAGSDVSPGDKVTLKLDEQRRRDIEKHHTATHIMHWALHEAVDPDAAQQGSLVAPDRLRFDFNSKALEAEQVAAVEKLANEKVSADDLVSTKKVPHASIKDREDIMQFFGDKYGDEVRVVQIGGGDGTLDGWSMELCGGTHVRRTGEIGLFKIKTEGAIAAGIRRIEAVCGDHAKTYLSELAGELEEGISAAAAKLQSANAELEKADEKPQAAPTLDSTHAGVLREASADIETINASIAALRGHLESMQKAAIEAEKHLKKAAAATSAKAADAELAKLLESGADSLVASFDGAPQMLQELLNGLKKKQFGGVAFLVVNDGEKLHLGAFVAKDKTGDFQAGKLIQELAPIAGGKGGGKPEMARGAGGDVAKLDELLEGARELLS
ncbi:MAG: alanine--tRNA ligase [Verrucomicrobiota bacterium]